MALSIPFIILQLLKHDIAKPLANLINLSFSTGVFPTKLKMAKVIIDQYHSTIDNISCISKEQNGSRFIIEVL